MLVSVAAGPFCLVDSRSVLGQSNVLTGARKNAAKLENFSLSSSHGGKM